MFGHHATLPIDIDLCKELPEQLTNNFDNMDAPDIAVLEEEGMKRLKEARRNILAAKKFSQQKKDDFDRRQANPDSFTVGQLVLKKDFTRKKWKWGKLAMKCLGPYEINKILSKGIFVMMEVLFVLQVHTLNL